MLCWLHRSCVVFLGPLKKTANNNYTPGECVVYVCVRKREKESEQSLMFVVVNYCLSHSHIKCFGAIILLIMK